jgi:hypothetical protein
VNTRRVTVGSAKIEDHGDRLRVVIPIGGYALALFFVAALTAPSVAVIRDRSSHPAVSYSSSSSDTARSSAAGENGFSMNVRPGASSPPARSAS